MQHVAHLKPSFFVHCLKKKLYNLVDAKDHEAKDCMAMAKNHVVVTNGVW